MVEREKGLLVVNPVRTGDVPVEAVELPPEGRVVHLKNYGIVRVFRIVHIDGNVEYRATSDLEMTREAR